MNLLRRDEQGLVLALSSMEKQLLEQLPPLYPLTPADHQRLGRQPGSAPAEGEEWLRESRAQQRRENEAWLKGFLTPESLKQNGPLWELTLSHERVETLLQVLNDIRVGAWVRLGCPDPLPGLAALITSAPSADQWLMLAAGHLQMELLDALDESSGGSAAS